MVVERPRRTGRLRSRSPRPRRRRLYLVYGKALAAIPAAEALSLPVEAPRAPQGTDQNILLIDSGDAQLGFVTTGTALSERGTAAARGPTAKNCRL